MTMRVAVIGSGNIGTDLTVKILRSDVLDLAALVGIDPGSDGLARARRLGVPTTSEGVAGLLAMPGFQDVEVVLDATSAAAHVVNAAALSRDGLTLVDLTPAAIGPFVVPAVNLDDHLEAPNLNMVTCGGQATIPIVAALARVTPVHYAEIIASISSRSAGPGTRANIDEFTVTTARAIEEVGGARRGKAVIVLNPAKPPMIMRDTVFCLVGGCDHDAVRESITRMVETVANYVPGYRLKQHVQIRPVAFPQVHTLVPDAPEVTTRVSVYLEVEGAADYLPPYAGNLDIMTAAAVRVAERLATTRTDRRRVGLVGNR